MPALTTDIFGVIAENVTNTSPPATVWKYDMHERFPSLDWEQDVVTRTHKEQTLTSTPKKPNKGLGESKGSNASLSETMSH